MFLAKDRKGDIYIVIHSFIHLLLKLVVVVYYVLSFRLLVRIHNFRKMVELFAEDEFAVG